MFAYGSSVFSVRTRKLLVSSWSLVRALCPLQCLAASGDICGCHVLGARGWWSPWRTHGCWVPSHGACWRRAAPNKDRSGGRWDGGTRQASGAVVLAGRFRILSKEVKISEHRRRWPAGWPLGTTEAGGARGAGLCSPPVLASSPVFLGSHTCTVRLPVGFADVTADLPRSHSQSASGDFGYLSGPGKPSTCLLLSDLHRAQGCVG